MTTPDPHTVVHLSLSPPGFTRADHAAIPRAPRVPVRPAPTPPRWAVVACALAVAGLMIGGWW